MFGFKRKIHIIYRNYELYEFFYCGLLHSMVLFIRFKDLILIANEEAENGANIERIRKKFWRKICT